MTSARPIEATDNHHTGAWRFDAAATLATEVTDESAKNRTAYQNPYMAAEHTALLMVAVVHAMLAQAAYTRDLAAVMARFVAIADPAPAGGQR